MGDEVVVMRAGRIAQRGTPAEIYQAPADRFVAEFVGRSNWFNGSRQGLSAQGVSSYLTTNGLEIRAKTAPSDRRDSAGLCIRPENIELIDDAAGKPVDGYQRNSLAGVIIDVAPLGADVHVVIELTGRSRLLAIRKNVGGSLAVGQSVNALFSPSDVLVF